jgi:phage gp29-like protein
MATPSLLTNQVAQRAQSLDFTALGLLLPNPDPILKAQGRDIAVYRSLCNDALVGGCIRRRKSAVKSLDWGLDKGQAASRTAKAVQTMLDALDLERIIGQMLEATLFGYQPMEITWARQGGLLVPVDLQAKPPEWFCFDTDNQLRFKTRTNPLFGEALPERKFLLPRQDPTYQNPYGFADLSMVYWPLMFKKGGMKFWLAFAEKFGSAFSIGKLPRGATMEERATLLDSLEALIQDGVATIPDDGSVELVEMAGKAASADLYEKMVLHCRGEISIALLGQNQTTEASANRASSVSGLEVTKDLRDGDAEMVSAAFNQLIRWVTELNWGAAQGPTFSMWDQKDQDTLQAGRDKSNFEAGAKFTNAYWMRAYGYQEGDLLPETALAPAALVQAATKSIANTQGASFSEASQDPVASATDTLVTASAPQWAAMVAQLQTLVDQAPSLSALQQTLTQAYGAMDSADLVKLMAAAYALAELKGIDAAAL